MAAWDLEGDEIIAVFLNEAREHLSHIGSLLASLPTAPHVLPVIDQIFRRVHTLKGGAAAAEFGVVSDLAHELESMLVAVRKHGGFVSAAQRELFSAGVQKIEVLINQTARLAFATTPILKTAQLGQTPALAAVGLAGNLPAEKAELLEGVVLPSVELSDPLPYRRLRHDDFNYLNVLARQLTNQVGILQESTASGQTKLQALELHRLVSCLNDHLQVCRTEAIGSLFTWLRRIIKRVSRELNKTIVLETSGDELRIDHSLLEGLATPLLHLVTNCCDHGIENTRARKAAGKPSKGLIRIEAFQMPGRLVIEVHDDGRGIDVNAIKTKAVASGIKTKSEVNVMADAELQQLLFLPGFSLAKKITHTSGRGYGLDIVKANLEKLGGTAVVMSGEGQGACFTLQLPVTWAGHENHRHDDKTQA